MTGEATETGLVRREADALEDLRQAVIMMVDDEPTNIEVTQVYLEEAGYARFVSTTDPTQVLQLFTANRPDVLLLDLMMPKVSGFDILQQMKEENLLHDIPAIVLTSSTDAATKLKALELGATDFLAKPVDPSELVLRVRNTLAAKAYRDRLANFDPLTGLPNRHTFLDRLAWAVNDAKRSQRMGAVLHLDLDKFREVNEALGPKTGDLLLQIVAKRLRQCLRNTDTVGRGEDPASRPSLSRIVGDEFTVLLPSVATTEGTAGVAARLLAAVAEPLSLEGHEVACTCSIGISVFPEDAREMDDVVKNAAVAAQHAKEQGRNRYQFYSSELNARALYKLNLRNELRLALERDELRLYLQPKVNVASGEVVGAEALVRWQHPQRGLVPPGEFIPLAEETGLIVPLGEWVLRAACRHVKDWQASGRQGLRIAVNVSAHQFREKRLNETIETIARESGVSARGITIELTESVLMDQARDQNVEVLLALKELGFKLSIDDFGTGYSSLSYLERFPLDELKIDRSFVMSIKSTERPTPLVAAIIAMAHGLGLIVVAEGVEKPEQLAHLRLLKCDEYQGFLMSKPIPAEEFNGKFLAPVTAAQPMTAGRA
jgi:diguanylate cyclase (GGDEF)-like protein